MILPILLASLIISPTNGKEGIQRVANSNPTKYEYRIAYKNDLMALLEGISWVHLHGFRDHDLTDAQMEEVAKKRKLFIACGFISRFTIHLLRQQGYQCRHVAWVTTEARNNYDDGHVMVEVYHNKHWILVDIDARRMFWHKDHYCSAKELLERGAANVDIIKFSEAPIIGYGYMNGYDIYCESAFLNEDNLRKWYKRICQTVSYY